MSSYDQSGDDNCDDSKCDESNLDCTNDHMRSHRRPQAPPPPPPPPKRDDVIHAYAKYDIMYVLTTCTDSARALIVRQRARAM